MGALDKVMNGHNRGSQSTETNGVAVSIWTILSFADTTNG